MTCRKVQQNLAAYFDGELGGADRLAIASHLDGCAACTAEIDSLEALGDLLRGSVPALPPAEAFSGLAPGVVSRISAEDRQSWRSRLAVMCEDWHWLAVGSGACSGAFVSALLVFAMLYSPTTQARQLNERVGTLYIMTLPGDGSGQPNVLEYSDALESPTADHRYSLPGSYGWLGEQELVSQLDRSLMRHGRYLRFDELSADDREEVSRLMEAIIRSRQSLPNRRPSGPATVTSMHLYINEHVTAAGL